MKQNENQNKNNQILIGVSVVGLLLVQQGLRIPSWTFLLDALNNSMHVPLFMAITYLLIRILPSQYGKVFIIGLLLAIGSEFLQGLNNREASLSDVLLDVTGIVAMVLFFQWRYWLARTSVLAVAMLIAALQPLWVLAAHDFRHDMWPALMDLSDPRGSVLTHTNSNIEFATPPDAWLDAPDKVVHVMLANVPWPGFHLQEVIGDWSEQQYLMVSLYIPGDRKLDLYVGVRERNRRRTTAFVERRLAPGAHNLRIPREALAPGVTQVRDVLIYTHQKDAGREFFVGEVVLLAQ